MENKDKKLYRKIAFPFIFLISILIIGFIVFDVTWNRFDNNSANSAKTAIRRAAVSCYSIEGIYPPDILYLESRYGLIIDHETFIVHYETFGSNIVPDVDVFFKNPRGNDYGEQ